MGTVGIFAGRGDVIIMMAIAVLLGFIAGCYFQSKRHQFRLWRESKKSNK